MSAKRRTRILASLVSAGAVWLAAAGPAAAQIQTQQIVSEGAATQKVTIERGEVVWVSGNNLMVRGEKDGQLHYFPDIPNTARAMVSGKELGVTDLRPGMTLERTTIVTTTPRTIRTVRSLTGTVFRVLPPNQVILTLANKQNQRFTIPSDQKFVVNGKETDASSLREGMQISASVVSDALDEVVTKQVTTTGVAPAPPAPPPPNAAILIIEPEPAAVATTGALPAQLPRTGSAVPLMGLLGLALCGAAGAIRLLRKA